jgi:hypothetical protein
MCWEGDKERSRGVKRPFQETLNTFNYYKKKLVCHFGYYKNSIATEKRNWKKI